MATRYYSNAAATALSGSVTALDTTITVDSVTGLPIQYPFVMILDRGTAAEEVVLVTNASGTDLTVSRGYDDTTAFAHSAGAEAIHGVSAIDHREANTHINATSSVHGLTGDVVGTTDTQTVTNKDLSSASNTFPSSLATEVEVASAVSTHAALTATHGVAGAVVGTTDTQTLTNKTISADNNTISGLAASSFAQTNASGNLDGSASAKAVPTGDVVGTTDTQTLTNKTYGGFTASKIVTTDGSGNLSASTTIPSGTLVGTDATQTLTNKNLTEVNFGGGAEITRLNFGSVNLTTNGSGEATFAHGLGGGATPSAVFVQSKTNGVMRFPTVTSVSSTGITIRVNNHDGSTADFISGLTFYFLAIA